MYIESIRIYDVYDEKGKELGVNFFKDLTLLVGKNGSGKTTILNILSNVISGNIYFLKDYKFSKVVIYYNDGSEKELCIEKNDNDGETSFKIDFERKEHKIFINSLLYRRMDTGEISSDLIRRNSVLRNIRNVFNQFYLPMDRYADYDLGMMRYNNNRYYSKNPYKDYLNDSIRSICDLIQDYSIKTNIKVDIEYRNFRKEIIDILSDLTIDFPNISDLIIPNTKEECQIDKKEFLKALEKHGINTSGKKESYDNFFDILLKRANDEYDENSKTFIDLIWQATQYKKIKEVITASRKCEEKIKTILLHKNSFVDMINGYFNPKIISITDEAEVKVEVKGSTGEINLTELSSGEKQLFITIGSLFFGIKEKASSIFIIDEPESSLHIDWQEKFTKSVCSINDNIQIIIATHSPEILGDYTNRIIRINV